MKLPQAFRKKPVEFEAMQWTGSKQAAEDLWEWTALRRGDVLVGWFWAKTTPTRYSVATTKNAEGYTACIYVAKSGQWANLRTGDWVIRETDGSGFYPCAADVFTQTCEAVPR